MSWDIQPGQERLYDEFMVHDFLPALIQMGLEPCEVWYSLWGEGPQMLIGCVTDDKTRVQRVFQSDAWRTLRSKLAAYVTNYRHKIVDDNGNFFQL